MSGVTTSICSRTKPCGSTSTPLTLAPSRRKRAKAVVNKRKKKVNRTKQRKKIQLEEKVVPDEEEGYLNIETGVEEHKEEHKEEFKEEEPESSTGDDSEHVEDML